MGVLLSGAQDCNYFCHTPSDRLPWKLSRVRNYQLMSVVRYQQGNVGSGICSSPLSMAPRRLRNEVSALKWISNDVFSRLPGSTTTRQQNAWIHQAVNLRVPPPHPAHVSDINSQRVYNETLLKTPLPFVSVQSGFSNNDLSFHQPVLFLGHFRYSKFDRLGSLWRPLIYRPLRSPEELQPRHSLYKVELESSPNHNETLILSLEFIIGRSISPSWFHLEEALRHCLETVKILA
ncbi:hypothetical protein M011DRAFT_15492 [Sporormia fimetaria CBS 119925]|uniref:Uncharacterized protein n=1 Tax=Sporormia fimetaria CBS 119925 TaxID=1340428 RepID=A0A6A6VQK3_9PLEO|nr:hypothetical protein M011DRAFT_15492 [Sporormia fimetaria CBS 119925]